LIFRGKCAAIIHLFADWLQNGYAGAVSEDLD